MSSSTAAASPTVVRPGQVVPVSGRGFAPRAAVVVRLDRDLGHQRTVRADVAGRVRTAVRAPRTPGSHTVFLVGAPPTGRPPRGGTVSVTVPRLVRVGLVVRGPRPGGRGGRGGLGVAGAGAGPSAGGRSPLAATGTDLRTPAVWSVALLVLGAALAAAGRRRRG